MGTWNVCGIGNKWDPLVQAVGRNEIGILGVTEHHMREVDRHKLGPNSKYVWLGKVSNEIAITGNKCSQGVGFLVCAFTDGGLWRCVIPQGTCGSRSGATGM